VFALKGPYEEEKVKTICWPYARVIYESDVYRAAVSGSELGILQKLIFLFY